MTATKRTAELDARVRQLKGEGNSFKQIAAATGLTESTVAGVLKDRTKDNAIKRQKRAAQRAAKAGGEPVASVVAAIPVPPVAEADEQAAEHDKKIIALRRRGCLVRDIALHLRVSIGTVERVCERAEANGQLKIRKRRKSERMKVADELAAMIAQKDSEQKKAKAGDSEPAAQEETPQATTVEPAAEKSTPDREEVAEPFDIDPEFSALIPPLTPAEYAQLEANLVAEGPREPLLVWRPAPGERPLLIDGHNRNEICTRLGIAGLRTREVFLPDRAAARRWIIDNQLGRRNLTGEQKRVLIAAVLQSDPSRSNRRIAEKIGVDHKTVANVREEQEASGEIPQLAETTGKDGRVRRKKERTETPPREPVENIPDADADADQRQGDLFAGGSQATPTPYPAVPPGQSDKAEVVQGEPPMPAADLFAAATVPGTLRLNNWPDDVAELVDAVASVSDEAGRQFLLTLAEATNSQVAVVVGYVERLLAFAPDERAEFIGQLSARLAAGPKAKGNGRKAAK